MGSISLRNRRLMAFGVNARDRASLSGRYFRGIGNRATLTTALTGANNDLYFMARSLGTAGNAITIRYVVAGNSTPLTVSVASSAITVNVATSAGGAATSTAADIRKALKANAAALALVWPSDAPGNDGSGVVIALAATNLAGATATV